MKKLSRVLFSNTYNNITQYYFWCPACDGVHTFTDAWKFNGDVNNPSLVSSVLTNKDSMNPTVPICHLLMKNGKLDFCNDCTHGMAGQKDIPMGPMPEWCLN